MRALGMYGWVELNDHNVQVEVDALANNERAYVSLVEASVTIAVAAVRAREALSPAPWEIQLRKALQTAAAAEKLRLENDGLSIAGDVDGCPIEVRLDAAKRYSLFVRAFFPAALEGEPFIEPRHGFLSKLGTLFRRRPTRNARFNWLFDASDEIDALLSKDAFEMFTSFMSRSSAAALDSRSVRFRTTDLEADPLTLLQRLSALRRLIAKSPALSPYR